MKHADDILIMARTEKNLRNIFGKWEKFAKDKA